jgi:hypothetical protein
MARTAARRTGAAHTTRTRRPVSSMSNGIRPSARTVSVPSHDGPFVTLATSNDVK